MASLTKYYHVIKSLTDSSFCNLVSKQQLIKIYNLYDCQHTKLLMALPPVEGDMPPSKFLDKMKVHTSPEERPSSLFWHAFLLISMRTVCLS